MTYLQPSAAAMAPPPIDLGTPAIEEVFVDGYAVSALTKPSINAGGILLTLELNIPRSTPEKPLQDIELKRILDTIGQQTHRLRLSLVNDVAAKLAFERMDTDGSIRPLAKGEGTW